MAYRAGYEIMCSCGEKFSAQVCEYIFAEYDPELRDALLGGELNVVTCPSCREVLPVENRMLYRDEKNRLWIWMCKKGEESRREELSAELMEANPFFEDHHLDQKDEYRKHLVFGRNALIALLLQEDSELKRREGPCMRRNPAFRVIMDGNRKGLLFLEGEKVSVALPLDLPPGQTSEQWGPEEKIRWLEHYSQGLNLHNPFSSFLGSRMKREWERILRKEPGGGLADEYEDFAHSWAGNATDRQKFATRCPLRARFFDDLINLKVTREVQPLDAESIKKN